MNNNLEIVTQNAVEHKNTYPTFDLDGFMSWINTKPPTWLGKAAKRTTADLNKSRRKQIRFERFCAGQD